MYPDGNAVTLGLFHAFLISFTPIVIKLVLPTLWTNWRGSNSTHICHGTLKLTFSNAERPVLSRDPTRAIILRTAAETLAIRKMCLRNAHVRYEKSEVSKVER